MLSIEGRQAATESLEQTSSSIHSSFILHSFSISFVALQDYTELIFEECITILFIMRFYQLLVIASVATALPLEVVTRQLDRTGITENEFSRSSTCGKVVFVWARGSTEAGNMVRTRETKSALPHILIKSTGHYHWPAAGR
jgi:hypothetical protein